MYRVMPTDPAPDGTYQGVSGVAPDEATEDQFTVVFKVPRLEAHVQDGADHYTIVLPRYVADELKQRAEESQKSAAPAPGVQLCISIGPPALHLWRFGQARTHLWPVGC